MQVDKKSLDFRLMCLFTDMPPLAFTPLHMDDCFGQRSQSWYVSKLIRQMYPEDICAIEANEISNAALECFFRFKNTFGEN